jgi:hypothetical protein
VAPTCEGEKRSLADIERLNISCTFSLFAKALTAIKGHGILMTTNITIPITINLENSSLAHYQYIKSK